METTQVYLETGVDVAVQRVHPEHMEQIRTLQTPFYLNVEREGIVVEG